MGGGPDRTPERVLCLLQWPESRVEASLKKLREEFPHDEIIFKWIGRTDFWPPADAPSPDPDLFKDKTILMTSGVPDALPSKPSDFPKGAFIQLTSAGVNHLKNHPIYTDSDIPLCTSSGIHGPQIAEWVIMTTLVHSHEYHMLHEKQKQHQWKFDRSMLWGLKDMVGQRLGVLGYGSIGRQVARVGKAMGMDVIAYTAHPKDTPEKRADHGYLIPGTGDPDGSLPSAWYSGTSKEELHEFLAQDIDILLISVPLTKDTRHMLSTEEFHIMNAPSRKTPPPFIVNIARGPIIDQDALVEALTYDRLRGAALDVADPEPLPPDNPLWTAPNVIITPHISGYGGEYVERCFGVLAENLRRRHAGERLLNVVDRTTGY